MTSNEKMNPADTDLEWRTNAWGREAQRVQAIAARLGLPMDGEDLALQDVRDLQRLQLTMHNVGAARTGRGAVLELWRRIATARPWASHPRWRDTINARSLMARVRGRRRGVKYGPARH